MSSVTPDGRLVRHVGKRERTAIIFLLLGGFLVGVGWLVGVGMLWASRAWSTSEKMLGTLVVPGGLATMVRLITTFAISSKRESTAHNVLVAAGAAVLVIIPVGTAISTLGRHER